MPPRAATAPAPLVSVVVPVLDEATRIAECIRAIAAQDMAPNAVEVIVVDGGSHDATVAVAERELAAAGLPHARVVRSDDGSRSGNLNTGLALARGTYLCRVDARSRIPAGYVRRCCEVLGDRPDVAVVGGRQHAVASTASPLHVGIARALNNRWAMGGARYRGGSSGPADTVYLGAFRTAELRAAGGWRTALAVNEDFDLNRRMSQRGVVWFDSSLVVDYVPRESLRALVGQYAGFGRAKARYWRISHDRPQPRQVALLTVPAALAVAGAAAFALASPAQRLALALGGAAAVACTDVAGADSPRGDVRAHAVAVAGMACIAGGWLGGAWSGALGAAGGARHA